MNSPGARVNVPYRGAASSSSITTSPKTLADAGFIVAAINHPGDTYLEMSRSGDLSAFVERPTDIKRLIPIARRICSTAADIFGAEDIAASKRHACLSEPRMP
jgi:predicted dienelactone hydrolase